MLNEKFLDELEEYLKSGRLEEDFEYSTEDRRYSPMIMIKTNQILTSFHLMTAT